MSGVLGIFYTDGRTVERAELERMLEALAHRGRDGSGCWLAGDIGLGHRMFWTTPESLQETLPLPDATAGLAITADARIDNRDELFTALGLTGECRAEVSDSRLILAAYARWGEACVEHLLGDFAFAIWDARRQHLFCARDHFGLRPFYYAQRQGTFIFASEIKGLLVAPELGTLNEAYLAGYLVPLFDDARATAYREVFRLPPAHTLTVCRDKVVLRRYWRLETRQRLRLRSDAEYAEAFREVFAEAVRCRMRSPYPLGATLSGGLDSSSITCMARHLLATEGGGGLLHTYSSIFDTHASCDERPFINAVLAQGGITPHLVPVEHIGAFSAYCAGQPYLDEPYIGTTLYLHWGMYGAAQGQVRTILDGHGGDNIVSHGFPYLTELAWRGHWRTLRRELHAAVARMGGSRQQLLWNVAVSPFVPAWGKRIWRWWRRRGAADDPLAPTCIAAALAKRTGLTARMQTDDFAHRAAWSVREEQRRDLEQPVYAMIFEWFNMTAHRFLLDARYPFFDRRLADFCLALPPEQKLQQGWSRIVLRRAMDGLLPPEIQWRPGKADLSPCFFHNLLSDDRDLLLRTLESGMELLAPYVETTRLREHLQQWTSDAALLQRHWKPLWFAATLAVWLQSRDTDVHHGKEAVFNVG